MGSERIADGINGEQVDVSLYTNGATSVYSTVHHGAKISSPQMEQLLRRVHKVIGGVHLYRWETNLLAMPNAPDASRRFRMERDGFGLTLILDDILGYDRKRFDELESRFRGFFPEIRSIKLKSEPAFKSSGSNQHESRMLQRSDGKGIHFELNDGTLIRASQASDGLVLVLAYLAVLYLPEPPRVLLMEEPENGIHPKRLEEVLKILRELVGDASTTQVIITTHSPYVLDHFEPDEVTICRKDADGAVMTRRLSESEVVRRQSSVFSLGEIWTGEGDEALAANGDAEAQTSAAATGVTQ
jgi:hypothetical protein